MTFKAGDRVRLKWRPQSDMSVKLVSGDYVLCEAWPGSGINIGAWAAEALEPAPAAPLIRRLSTTPRQCD